MKIADTSRLQMELMTRDDAQLLFELDQDPEVMKYINGGKMSSMNDIIHQYIPRLKKFTNKEKGWGLWKVTIKATDKFIGWILVRPMGFFEGTPQLNNLELGWRFKQDTWGKGYATEASQQVMDTMLALDPVKTVSATALSDNHGSIKIMQKLGMKLVKSYRHQDDFIDADAVLYQRNHND